MHVFLMGTFSFVGIMQGGGGVLSIPGTLLSFHQHETGEQREKQSPLRRPWNFSKTNTQMSENGVILHLSRCWLWLGAGRKRDLWHQTLAVNNRILLGYGVIFLTLLLSIKLWKSENCQKWEGFLLCQYLAVQNIDYNRGMRALGTVSLHMVCSANTY